MLTGKSRTSAVPAALLLMTALTAAQWLPRPAAAQETSQATEPFGGLPPGPAQAEVYGLCSACHSLMIVKQQRLSKEAWLDTLQWMTEEQGMPPLPPEMLDRIAGYLGEHYGSAEDQLQ